MENFSEFPRRGHPTTPSHVKNTVRMSNDAIRQWGLENSAAAEVVLTIHGLNRLHLQPVGRSGEEEPVIGIANSARRVDTPVFTIDGQFWMNANNSNDWDHINAWDSVINVPSSSDDLSVLGGDRRNSGR